MPLTFAKKQVERLRDLTALLPGRRIAFSDDAEAQQLCKMMEMLQRGAFVRPAFRDEVERLTLSVTRAIRSRQMTLDYAAPADGSVALPALDTPLYLQALLYWCAHLRASVPRVVEACARAGDGATLQRVKDVIAEIETENRLSKTDVFFVQPQARDPRIS